MKTKFRVLPVICFALALTSCDFNDFYASISELVIEGDKTNFKLGDIFTEKSGLKIHATYSNGKKKDVNYDQVDIELSCSGVTYNAYRPFEVEGKYKVTVSKGFAKSNTVEIYVYDKPIYATDVSLEISKTSLKTMDLTQIAVTVNPSSYNLDVEYESSRETGIIKKTSENHYEFYESKAGKTTVTFKAKSGEAEGQYVTASYTFDVEASAQEAEILQTYKDLSNRNSPTIGEVKYLIIPVWFNESPDFIKTTKRDLVREDIEKAYFGTESDTGWNSVSSYYKYESNEKFIMTGTVSEWYEPGISLTKLGKDDDRGSKTSDFASQAADWYFENHKKDSRTNYDSDGDGYIDGLMVIYGVPDYYSNGVGDDYREYSNLWAYCAATNKSASVLAPTVGLFFWASYDFMYGYQAAVDRTGNKYYKGNNAHNKIDTHTYIHEMGHIFGLNDYYDYSKQTSPAGGFSMQDYNVGGHDPFSVLSFGWANPYVPTESCKIKISEFQKSKELILLTPGFNEYNSPFDEYLLLELYSPTGLNETDARYQYSISQTGYPQGPMNTGIRVWHIDARLSYYTYGYDCSTTLYTNAKLRGGMFTAFSNTKIDKSYDEAHVSKLAKYDVKYAEYNLLNLIRKNDKATYRSNDNLGASDLFVAGDEFSVENYKLQFPYSSLYHAEDTLLNSGIKLGWSFSIESIDSGAAIINVTKI